MKSCLTAALMLALPVAAVAAPVKELPPKPSVGDIVKASKPTEWRQLDPANTLYMDLPAGRVIIELAPAFAPNHAANIRTMAKEGYWDGLWVYRVQDNFVAQWGDPRENKPKSLGKAKAKLEQEFTVPLKNDTQFTRLMDKDGYAVEVGHSNGFPAARDPNSGQTWLVHCYGMVGVARDNAPDTGDGTELYAVIGQAPRQLDRNITLVGRVIDGLDRMTSRPRGTEALGFYKTPAERTVIASARIAADLPAGDRPAYEVLDSDGPAFAAWVKLRANRKDAFYVRPASAVDICNAVPPIRKTP